MRIIHLLSFSVLSFFIGSAHAESPFTGGMKYTAVKKALNAAPAEAKEFEETGTEKEESAADKVWKKYRKLAAGEEKPAEESKTETAPKEEPRAEETKADVKPEPKKQATGFASILQKYEQSKAKRSELRSIKVERPAAPTKPKVND